MRASASLRGPPMLGLLVLREGTRKEGVWETHGWDNAMKRLRRWTAAPDLLPGT